eukprot:CAMPEP_0172648152 /NCGR_PEP_ID=MMETSP1068-20121228/241121_1 /TAXON_ID=35684 /ORGANISM="Pseudopedinella elastica, Strain CCMP716" /LENGTH=262 /DNA_ID=CAMNT_0013462459 /DNA_START=468 /DNA_END=1257 /DNA_ORIENTATION=+
MPTEKTSAWTPYEARTLLPVAPCAGPLVRASRRFKTDENFLGGFESLFVLGIRPATTGPFALARQPRQESEELERRRPRFDVLTKTQVDDSPERLARPAVSGPHSLFKRFKMLVWGLDSVETWRCILKDEDITMPTEKTSALTPYDARTLLPTAPCEGPKVSFRTSGAMYLTVPTFPVCSTLTEISRRNLHPVMGLFGPRERRVPTLNIDVAVEGVCGCKGWTFESKRRDTPKSANLQLSAAVKRKLEGLTSRSMRKLGFLL